VSPLAVAQQNAQVLPDVDPSTKGLIGGALLVALVVLILPELRALRRTRG
jgi:hypothetical protein